MPQYQPVSYDDLTLLPDGDNTPTAGSAAAPARNTQSLWDWGGDFLKGFGTRLPESLYGMMRSGLAPVETARHLGTDLAARSAVRSLDAPEQSPLQNVGDVLWNDAVATPKAAFQGDGGAAGTIAADLLLARKLGLVQPRAALGGVRAAAGAPGRALTSAARGVWERAAVGAKPAPTDPFALGGLGQDAVLRGVQATTHGGPTWAPPPPAPLGAVGGALRGGPATSAGFGASRGSSLGPRTADMGAGLRTPGLPEAVPSAGGSFGGFDLPTLEPLGLPPTSLGGLARGLDDVVPGGGFPDQALMPPGHGLPPMPGLPVGTRLPAGGLDQISGYGAADLLDPFQSGSFGQGGFRPGARFLDPARPPALLEEAVAGAKPRASRKKRTK